MPRRIQITITAVLLAVVLPLATFTAGVRLADRDEPPGFDRIASVANELLENGAHPVTVDALVHAAIEAMLAATGDPYAAVLDPEQRDVLSGLVEGETVVGIGVWIERTGRSIRVTGVIPDTPADREGLTAGDLIVEIDGEPVVAEEVGGTSSPLRGPAGSTVELTIVRGERRFTVELVRERIPIPNVVPRLLQGGVGYLAVLAFGEGVSKEIRRTIAEQLAGGAPGIVLDLRDNPGGLAHEAFDTAEVFIESGLLGTIQERDEDPIPIRATGGALRQDFPLVVLVNGRTASAAEILAAALQDLDRAQLVGERTFGKGSVLTVIPVPDGGPTIQFTTAFFLRPDGRQIEKRGVAPDYPVSLFGMGDPQLRRALGLVLERSGA